MIVNGRLYHLKNSVSESISVVSLQPCSVVVLDMKVMHFGMNNVEKFGSNVASTIIITYFGAHFKNH